MVRERTLLEEPKEISNPLYKHKLIHHWEEPLGFWMNIVKKYRTPMTDKDEDRNTTWDPWGHSRAGSQWERRQTGGEENQ